MKKLIIILMLTLSFTLTAGTIGDNANQAERDIQKVVSIIESIEINNDTDSELISQIQAIIESYPPLIKKLKEVDSEMDKYSKVEQNQWKYQSVKLKNMTGELLTAVETFGKR